MKCLHSVVPGSDPIGDLQPHFAIGLQIRRAHRIAVDRGIIERRHVHRRDDIFDQDAAGSFTQRHRLIAIDLRDALGNQTFGIIHREGADH